MKNATKRFCTAFLLLLWATPAISLGDWMEFDTFNSIPVGSHVSDQTDWVAPLHVTDEGTRNIISDPQLPANPVLEYFSNSMNTSSEPAYVSRPLGSLQSVDLDTAHTMFMRFYLPAYNGASTNGPDIMISLKAGPVIDSGASGMGPHLRIDGSATNTNILQVSPDNAGFQTLNTSSSTAPTLAEDTWYNMWMVTDNSADTYEVYIQGGTGAFATQQQLQVGTGAEAITDIMFRDNRPYNTDPNLSGVQDQHLDTLWLRGNSSHSDDTVLFDHIFIDQGQNLTIPPAPPYTIPVIVADRITGEITIENKAGASSPYAILGYSIVSASGALESQNWNTIAGHSDDSQTGDGSVDPDDEWTVLSAAGSNYDISEFQFNGTAFDGATITAGGAVDLNGVGGGVWIPTPVEDLIAQITYADGNVVRIPITYTGNGGEAVSYGDLNHDGLFDIGDWARFQQGQGVVNLSMSPAKAYSLGDLNGDGRHNLSDFSLFVDLYNSEFGPGAFSAALRGSTVPEPSSLVLLSLALVPLFRRLWRYSYSASFRGAACLLLACLFFGGSNARGNQLLFEDFESYTPNMDLTTAGVFSTVESSAAENRTLIVREGTELLFGVGNQYLEVLDNSATLGPNALGDLSTTLSNSLFTVSLVIYEPASGGLGDSFRVALANGLDAANRAFEARFDDGKISGTFGDPSGSGSTVSVDNAYSLDTVNRIDIIGNLNANSGAAVDYGFGTVKHEHYDVFVNGSLIADDWRFRNLGIGSVSQLLLTSSEGELQAMNIDDLVVQDVAALYQPSSLKLVVNTMSNEVDILSAGDQSQVFGSYSITSELGTLDDSSWTPIANQTLATLPNASFPNASGPSTGDGWEAGPGSNEFELTEWFLNVNDLSPSTLAPGQSLSLGEVYVGAGAPDDLKFFYSNGAGQVIEGLVEFVSSVPTLPGDFNDDGFVNIADYTVWRDNLGGNEAALAGNGSGNTTVGPEDYALWKAHFGESSTPGAVVAVSVPEPATPAIWGLGFGSILALRRRFRMNLACFGAMLLPAMLAMATSASAVTTVVREYQLGDFSGGGVFENPQAPTNPAGDGDPLGTSEASYAAYDSNSAGQPLPFGFADLQLALDSAPIYHEITNADILAGHPGPIGSFSASFDGSHDFLQNADPRSATVSGFPQGMQMWVYPRQADLLGARQVIALDATNSGNSHGPAITADGKWTLTHTNHTTDGGIGATEVVAGDQWHHVATHVFKRNDSNAPANTNNGDFTVVLYVDGVAVAATNDQAGSTSDILTIGGVYDGTTARDLFSGYVDEVEVYNSSTNSFDLFNDNSFIRAQLDAIVGVGNSLPSGDVDHDGILNPVADVQAFIAGWRKENRLQGAHGEVLVGDWRTHGWGDLNLDGQVDSHDAYLMHITLLNETGSGLNFSLLTEGSTSVPEPQAVLLAALALVLPFVGRQWSN